MIQLADKLDRDTLFKPIKPFHPVAKKAVDGIDEIGPA